MFRFQTIILILLLCIANICSAETISSKNQLVRLVKLSVKGDVVSFRKEFTKYQEKNIPQQQDQYPLIWLIARYGSSNILDYLVKDGADPDSTNERSTQTPWPTPLFAAVIGNKIDNIKILLEAGADINYLNRSGYNAYVEALTLYRYDIALFLHDKGAKTDFKDAIDLLKAAVISEKSILWPYYEKLVKTYREKGIQIPDPQQP